MKYLSLLITGLLQLIPCTAFSTAHAFPDLPRSDFILLDSTVIPEKDNAFFSQEENGYLVLRSSLSPQWYKGIYFNLQNGRVTVPGVGAGNLVKTRSGYSWVTHAREEAFEKNGRMTLSRLAHGCELVWEFSVVSRGQRLINESGRMGYACSSGKPQTTLAQQKPVKILPLKRDTGNPIINPEAPSPVALGK